MTVTIQSIVDRYQTKEMTWQDFVRALSEFDYAPVVAPVAKGKPVEDNFADHTPVDLIVTQDGPEAPVEDLNEFHEAEVFPVATGVEGAAQEPVVDPGVVVDPTPGSFDELRKLVNEGVVDVDTYNVVLQGRQIIASGGQISFQAPGEAEGE